MLEIKSIDSNTLLVIDHNSIILINNINSENPIEHIEFKHNAEIVSGLYLPNRHLFAFADLNKKFLLIDIKNNFNILASKIFPKRAAKLLSNKNESLIILGDKTCDVYSLNIETESLPTEEFKLLMGHLSMLIDMRLSLDEKFLFTGDRDEKIRISHFPNSYNIDAYLMAHKEFVIQFEFINKNTLVSASGDSKLILWDLKTFKPIQKIDVKSLIKLQDESLKGIDKFDFNKNTNQLLLHVFKASFLLEFHFSEKENHLNYIGQLDVDDQIDDFTRLSDDSYLFTFLNAETSKSQFLIKKLIDNQLGDFEQDSKQKSLETRINEIVKIEKVKELKEEIEKNYLSYFKAIVHSISEYYERKQERIAATSVKRVKTDINSEVEVVESK